MFKLFVIVLIVWSSVDAKSHFAAKDIEELLSDVFGSNSEVLDAKTSLETQDIEKRTSKTCNGDRCYIGETLRLGQCLVSSKNLYSLCMEKNGNLVVYCYQSGEHKATWSSNTHGKNVRNGLVFQADGNLVIYNSDGKEIWSSNTDGKSILVTKTSSKGAHQLVMQDDGNAVLYGRIGKVYWETHTKGRCGRKADKCGSVALK